ncbi:hypothetical protein DBR32_14755 [Taibaiella sp. KBW10]|uniref:hypothetical protein n=1 Tax=Taibaiella sp. KBW10 TaxID=2153357 RepID=UPI000F594EF0|nr:hypothetical protein [Taibaiella sp. KBW10]RQO29841.1 hypothetical protein DBR32_14755 [Taibaiella sp. KBW10]
MCRRFDPGPHHQKKEASLKEASFFYKKSIFDAFGSLIQDGKGFCCEKLHLFIDGTYFSNDVCLIFYEDNEIKFTQLYRLSGGEHFAEIKEDLEKLLRLGVSIKSIACDGHKAI